MFENSYSEIRNILLIILQKNYKGSDIFSGGYVRILSAVFFGGGKYFPNWLAYLIGNGVEHFDSEYGKEIERYNQDYEFYRLI